MKQVVKGPNAVTAIQDAALSDIFTALNCAIVYAANGNYKSWVPGRDLNAFDTIEIGKGYIPIMLSTDPIDVSAYFSDGLPAGAGGFPYGFLVSNTSSKDIDFSYFNGSNVDMDAGGTILAGSFRYFHSADFITGAASVKFVGDKTNLQYLGITLINDAFVAQMDGNFTDFTNFAGIAKSTAAAAESAEALGIITVSDLIVPEPPPIINFLELINLTGHNLQVLTQDNYGLDIVDAYGNAFSEMLADGDTLKVNKAELDAWVNPSSAPTPVTGINLAPYPLDVYKVIKRVGNTAANITPYPDGNIPLISWLDGSTNLMIEDSVIVVVFPI